MSNIRYTAAGQVASWQWADGTAYQKSYDANNRLKTFPLGNLTRTLSYDTVGNITGWDDNGDAAKAKHFSYDLLDRLDSYTAANEAQAFQYDPNGNRTAKTDNGNTTAYGIQPNSNRLTQIGNTAQTQDANGNLLNDGTHIYTYNAQNRLASVDGNTTYSYNAADQRVKKTSPTGTTLYAWDNDRIIGEYATTNGAAQQATETVYFGNTPVAVIQNGNIYRIYADQIDTPRVITDASGKTVWAWDSKPFGETAPDEDPDKDGLSLHYNQRFPGQTFDAETGLHYNFHRDYNPQTGRYVQSDPIGLDGGMNTFGYVEGKPLSLTDVNGLFACGCSLSGSSGGVGYTNGRKVCEYKCTYKGKSRVVRGLSSSIERGSWDCYDPEYRSTMGANGQMMNYVYRFRSFTAETAPSLWQRTFGSSWYSDSVLINNLKFAFR